MTDYLAPKRIFVLVTSVAIGGCASSPQDSGQQLAGQPSESFAVAPALEVEPAGPPQVASSRDGVNQESVGIVDEDIAVNAVPTRTIDVGGHRPVWWFAEAQWSQERVTVCVEALGPDVLEARRASVRAAREAIRELLGVVPTQAEIVLTTVKPLPVPAAAPGGNRYAGYVMITCVVPEEA